MSEQNFSATVPKSGIKVPPPVFLAYVYPSDSMCFGEFDDGHQPIKEYFRSELFGSIPEATAWITSHADVWQKAKIWSVPGYCDGCCSDGEWFDLLEPGEKVGIVFMEGRPHVHCDGALWNVFEDDTLAHYAMPYSEPHSHSFGWDGYRRRRAICNGGGQCQQLHEQFSDAERRL